jgi:peroxiredoxin
VAVLEPGALFPSVSLLDGNGERAGLPKGEALYVFFKTTCPTCELTWPFLDRIRELGGASFPVVAVSQDDRYETVEFNDRLGVRIETLYDPKPWKASDGVGLESVPTLFLVDDAGRIRDTVVGFQRSKLEELGDRAARRAGREGSHEPVVVARPGEKLPELKPG